MALDWWVIPKDDSVMGGRDTGGPSQTEVLTVSVHKDTILKYQQIISGANLDVGFFEVEVFSTIRSALEPSINPMILLDLGSSTTKIYIVERGVIRDSHIINRGSQDITQALSSGLNVSLERAEDFKRGENIIGVEPQRILEIETLVLEDIFAEASRVILNYQKKRNKAVMRVVLAGGGSILSNALPVASKFFETEVTLADPFSKVEAPAFLRDVLAKAGPEFAVAIGVALRKLDELG